MKTSQVVWTIIMVLALFYTGYVALHPRDYFSTSVDFTVSMGDKVDIEGAECVSIWTEDDEYYRIYSGTERLLPVPNSDNVFVDESTCFPTKNWQILDGSLVDVTITTTSGSLLHVHKEYATETLIFATIIIFLFSLLIWIFGLTILK